MISVKAVTEVNLDLEDIIAHSPVAKFPWALKHLQHSTEASAVSYVGYIDDEVACIYGLVPPSLMSNKVYLWLLTTDVTHRRGFVFIRHSQMVIERILGHYEAIYGETLTQDERSIRWLKWLGASYLPPRGLFSAFYINRETFARRHG